jgi:hypothetical protein
MVLALQNTVLFTLTMYTVLALAFLLMEPQEHTNSFLPIYLDKHSLDYSAMCLGSCFHQNCTHM